MTGPKKLLSPLNLRNIDPQLDGLICIGIDRYLVLEIGRHVVGREFGFQRRLFPPAKDIGLVSSGDDPVAGLEGREGECPGGVKLAAGRAARKGGSSFNRREGDFPVGRRSLAFESDCALHLFRQDAALAAARERRE